MSNRLIPAVALGLATALVVAGCSSDNSNEDSTNSPAPSTSNSASAGAVGTEALTIGMPNGTQTDNSNPFVNTSSAQSLGYAYAIYEPLFQTTDISDTPPEPWLATEAAWNEDYTSVTFTVRDGVNWSDGTALTADDVAFSFQIRKDNEALNNTALPYGDITVDGNMVNVGFTQPVFVKANRVLNTFVVPKHIWEAIADPTTDLNQDPIGTGPYVLENWTPEAVKLVPNADYWGGTPAAPELLYTSYTDNAAMTTALVAGELQWGWTNISDYENVYIAKDPEHNHFWTPSGLAVDVLYLNNETKPFNDVAVRQALSMVTDRNAIFNIGSEKAFPEVTSITGMPTPAGNAFISSEYQGKEYSVDVEGAKKVLTDAGYKYEGDTLFDKDGEQVTFTLTDPAGWNDYVTTLQQIADMASQIGIEATVDTPDADSWFGDIAAGDFQASLHWTDGGPTPYDMYSDIMDGAYYLEQGEAANWNFGRYNNDEATKALADFSSASEDSVRQEAMDVVQKRFVEDQPAIIVRGRPASAEYSSKYYTGWPSDEDPYNQAQPTGPQASQILMKLKPATD
ncbi:ABC transporter substrate-binding protein [Demequina oxidasica]|uniref:ABC transporter substrate-binding protein n=1 Tax=Demequina oxidasica TaxID=676199 RepID=UPI000782DEBF|nr:ABC transporter substrate-binding protein [Demequina oxidasica]